MADLNNRLVEPSIEDIASEISNPLFLKLHQYLIETYSAKTDIAFSSCSWEYGWHVKMKKSGKTLCTFYPRVHYFCVMVVVGNKEKEVVEAMLPELSSTMREIYRDTKEGNGQRWLMIELEDEGQLYEDTLKLIKIRSGK